MTDTDKQLSHRQEAFCREYLIDMNATKAAVRAGYSLGAAKQQGHRLMSNPHIKEFLVQMMEERNKQTSIDANYVLQQAVQLCERCMQQVRPKTTRGKEVTDQDGNMVYEFDAANALKALEMIGRHINVGAFKERVEVSGDMLNAHFILAPIEKNHSPGFASSENEIEQ
ncbi:MAG: terminase small subunit [Dysgonomonas sp.]